MTRAFSAALFDLDGTLVDTEHLCNTTGVAACAALGVPVSDAFFEGLAGIHDAERVRLIAAHTGLPLDEQAFFDEWDRRTLARMEEGLELKPGARELLARLQAMALPLALVTSSRHGPAWAKLHGAGLSEVFARVVTVEDVAHAKPAPDPYLVAAQALGVAAADCVVFEDSDTGAMSAHKAGCTVVQIPDRSGQTGKNADIIAAGLLEGAAKVGLFTRSPA
ncbi:MAG: HAD family phosphatase [Rubellimicrobium sp.]|nr:HAD family phosphatase [Rubellimicrobium sp.]